MSTRGGELPARGRSRVVEGPTVDPDSPRRVPSTGPVVAAVGGLMALLAVAVAVAAVLAIDLRDRTRVADRHVDYVDAVHVAALHAKGIANDERGFLISGEAQFVNQLNDRVGDARNAFDAADRAAVGNAQHAAIYEVRDGFENWLWALRSEITRYRSGDTKGAIASSLGETRQLRKANEAAIGRARALGQNGVEDSTSALSDASWRAVRILVVYLLLALAIGFVVTIWLVRRVLRPVESLRQRLPEQAEVRALR